MLSKLIAATLFFNLSAQAATQGDANDFQDGQVIEITSTTSSVWDGNAKTTTSIEKFWQAYALGNVGKYWGRSSEYPPYEEVKEHDTLLIKVVSGDCLMEFFHSRWRRANDVRRWDERYNTYSGCPNVFD